MFNDDNFVSIVPQNKIYNNPEIFTAMFHYYVYSYAFVSTVSGAEVINIDRAHRRVAPTEYLIGVDPEVLIDRYYLSWTYGILEDNDIAFDTLKLTYILRPVATTCVTVASDRITLKDDVTGYTAAEPPLLDEDFIAGDNPSDIDDEYVGMVLVVGGETKTIVQYIASSRTVIVDSAFSVTPNVGDACEVRTVSHTALIEINYQS